MLKLLTFLGINDYTPTSYTWQGKQVKAPTPYVAEAFCELYEVIYTPEKISEVIVFLTPEARQKHWDSFQERLGNRCIIKDISIPSGKSEAELWQIFDAVVGAVEPGSQVLFDITNAYRSIPFLVFLAIGFLEKARNVIINGVYYGAFDANKKEPPIFDLTPALKLLDWLTATQQFITTGSSVGLGELLKTIQKDFTFNIQEPSTPPRLLDKFGTSIQDISRSLEMIRAMGVLQETKKLQNIPAKELAQEVGYFAKPFELLSSQIQQSYSQFVLSDPEKSENHQLALEKHFLLLRWYVKNNMGAQAILLAREWIVSAQCVKKGIIYLNKSNRETVEEQLNKLKGIKRNLTKATARSLEDRLILTWSNLTTYRNDIAHAEMRRDSANIAELQKYIKNDLIQSLENLFPEFVV
jgi:CRISPR-associated Csx2 family protein